MVFTFGSDPEFMIVDQAGNYVSAIDKVPGTKEEKLPLGNGHYAFYDNVLAECCPQPGNTIEKVLANFRDCFQRYAQVVNPYRLVPQASQTYPAKECLHPAASVFGCEPEENVYAMVTLTAPYCPEGNTFRSGGGHIHLGHCEGNEYPLLEYMGRYWIVRLLDFFVGIPSVLMDNDPTSQARRKLYGGAGNMRPKEYGVEYRTLSNFWLASPRLVSIIYDLCGFTLEFCQKGDEHQLLWEKEYVSVREAIDTGSKQAAQQCWSRLSPYVPASLQDAVKKMAKVKMLDFYAEWQLKV